MATLWDIDHETGDLSQYDSTVTDGGDLSVEAAAALAGTSWGLQCQVDDANDIYGQIASLDPGTGKFRFRFYIDPNSLSMPNNDMFHVSLQYTNIAPWLLCIVSFWRTAGVYVISFFPYDDAGPLASHTEILSDAEHYIEMYIEKETFDGGNDGRVRCWLDGVLKKDYVNVENFKVFQNMSVLRFGSVVAMKTTTSGSFYLDQLKANDDGSEIGAHVEPHVTGNRNRGLWIEHPERFTGLGRYSLY